MRGCVSTSRGKPNPLLLRDMSEFMTPPPLPPSLPSHPPSSCVKYVPEPEDSILLHTALKIYRRFRKYPQALRLALMLNDTYLIKEIFLECPDT